MTDTLTFQALHLFATAAVEIKVTKIAKMINFFSLILPKYSLNAALCEFLEANE
tara:strand:- start:46408 stop:46569 length:162 start_codon:yes stop_codon:yes gene_type:complete